MAIKTAQVTFTDGMHFDVATGSAREFAFDDLATDGLGPIETVLAALAGCSAMDVISIALKKRQGIERYTIHAEAEQREAYPQIYTRIELTHEVAGEVLDSSAIQRCIELSATKYCPVNAMLSAGDTAIHHRYRIVRPGQPVEEGLVIVTGPYARPDPIDVPKAAAAPAVAAPAPVDRVPGRPLSGS
jgi:putative redox protein